MVQIGDFHIGKAESAAPPVLDIMEAATVWDALVARYKCIEETNFYYKYAHDAEFKALIKVGIGVLNGQVDTLESQLIKFQMPMPNRPPLSINDPDSTNLPLSDQFMFRQIFEGCQTFLDYMAHAIRSMITNDQLRKMFTEFLTDEIFLFDKLCKFAKMKGWLEVPPLYKQ